MKAEYDERVGESQKLQKVGYIVKLISDEGLKDDATSNVNRRPFLLSAFNLNKSKKSNASFDKSVRRIEN